MKKNKISDLELVQSLASDSVRSVVEPAFNKWAKKQDMIIGRGLEEAKAKFTAEQKRHMEVIEKFLEIQTKLMKKYLK